MSILLFESIKSRDNSNIVDNTILNIVDNTILNSLANTTNTDKSAFNK